MGNKNNLEEQEEKLQPRQWTKAILSPIWKCEFEKTDGINCPSSLENKKEEDGSTLRLAGFCYYNLAINNIH